MKWESVFESNPLLDKIYVVKGQPFASEVQAAAYARTYTTADGKAETVEVVERTPSEGKAAKPAKSGKSGKSDEPAKSVKSDEPVEVAKEAEKAE